MTECQDPGCQKNLTEMRELMFKDAEGGLRYDISRLKGAMKDTVKQWQVWAFFAASLVVAVPLYIAIARTVFLYTPMAETHAIQDKVSQMEARYDERFAHMLATMVEIKRGQAEVLLELRQIRKHETKREEYSIEVK